MTPKKMGRDSSAARKTSCERKKLVCWLCKKFCGDRFFNRDASREIDRLVIEIENLRAGGKR